MMEQLIQGSQEWLNARAGSLGASSIHEAVAKTKTGYSASRQNLLARLVVERLTGRPVATYQNAAMLHGVETEPAARAAYEFYRAEEVEQIGLVKHPTIGGTHASPDGLVGTDGLLEIKCPQHAQHMATISGEPIQQKYMYQMLWQMRCCDRSWADFVSYNPDFPESMQFFCQRVHRDDTILAELEAEVIKFLAEVRSKVDELKRLYAPDPTDNEPQYLMAGE